MPATAPDVRPHSQQGKRTLAERASFDRISVARKSAEEFTHAFSSVSTAFHFADFVTHLNEASSEIRSFVNVIQRVRDDIFVASRVRHSKVLEQYCNAHPEERSWIDNILLDCQSALNDIGAYVENVRVAGDEGGAVRMKRKFEWILSHQHKVRDRQTALLVCHQSLSTAINFMQMVEMGDQPSEFGYKDTNNMSMIFEAPTQPWLRAEHGSILRSPYSRQKFRLSQRNLSLPGITVDEYHDNKVEENSINSLPAELPGSTPDDLPDPDNWDLYSSPTERRPTSAPHQTEHQPADAEQTHDAPETEEPAGPEESENSSPDSGDAHTVPLLAKRYRGRARPVRVPAATGRHSMPTQLPYIPQTPSLVEELSRWVAGYNFEPGDATDETETLSSSPFSSPTSASSSTPPTSAVSCPEKVPPFGSPNVSDSMNKERNGSGSQRRPRTATVPMEDSPTLPQGPLSPRIVEITDAASKLPTASMPVLEELPVTAAGSEKAETTKTEDIATKNELTKSEETESTQKPVSPSAFKEVPPVPSTQPPVQPSTSDENPPTLSPKPSVEVVQSHVILPKPSPVATVAELVPAPEQPKSSVEVTKIPEASLNTPDSKPLTSQAKRRRARERRMMAAYADD